MEPLETIYHQGNRFKKHRQFMTNFGTIWKFYVLDDSNSLTYFCVELYVSVFLFANYYRMLWTNKENISNKTKVTHNFKIREGGRVFVATRVHDFHCRGADSILGLSWVCWLYSVPRRFVPGPPAFISHTLNQYLVWFNQWFYLISGLPNWQSAFA